MCCPLKKKIDYIEGPFLYQEGRCVGIKENITTMLSSALTKPQMCGLLAKCL